ncbi:hypothetical protein DSO57_1000137 [Entomophthora muscae]|uniref:Uncharacterized protein n=1 Tax=Entomophthora muscae TaxID=34485 RepID=A0ACC2SME9_9FUNG|nr:hypothetical protein DSO57_1000137 [Entomophthora muscae]
MFCISVFTIQILAYGKEIIIELNSRGKIPEGNQMVLFQDVEWARPWNTFTESHVLNSTQVHDSCMHFDNVFISCVSAMTRNYFWEGPQPISDTVECNGRVSCFALADHSILNEVRVFSPLVLSLENWIKVLPHEMFGPHPLETEAYSNRQLYSFTLAKGKKRLYFNPLSLRISFIISFTKTGELFPYNEKPVTIIYPLLLEDGYSDGIYAIDNA